MKARYGENIAMAPGTFVGALSNGGEQLVLFAANGQEVFRFTYRDNIPSTDGRGRSLTRVLSSTAPTDGGDAWRASTADHGSPGATDAFAFIGNPLADLDQDGFIAMVEYAFGTSDTDATSVPADPAVTLRPWGVSEVTWSLRPNADDVEAIPQVWSGSRSETWQPFTDQPGTGQQFFRLHLRLR